jgi:hypothetical protein
MRYAVLLGMLFLVVNLTLSFPRPPVTQDFVGADSQSRSAPPHVAAP